LNAEVRHFETTADPVVESVAGGSSHPIYRPDIDGLRAVAVLSVLGYHGFPTALTGGFVGVDIFFVISGYLISGILLGNLERGKFSIADFYARRIRRIFPALLVVLLACLAAGWLELLASEYIQLGKHVAGGAGFISNLMLWRETGYFDNAAETKPLLHLWSLGIEEQFYIVWPLLLYLSCKMRFRALPVILVIGAASFALSIHDVHVDTSAAFYSPLSRFWELLLGGCLAYMGLHKTGRVTALDGAIAGFLARVTGRPFAAENYWLLRNLRAALGGALILVALLALDKWTAFPGWWALLPTLGSALVISAGHDAWVNRKVLSNKLMVAVGLISYPMYLWHWPLLSFAQIVAGDRPAWWVRLLLLATSVALATLTYFFIEKPLRFSGHRKVAAVGLAIAMLGVALFGCAIYKEEGFSFRAVAQRSEENRIAVADGAIRDRYPVRSCDGDSRIVGRARTACFQGPDVPDSKGVIVVWGDSQAEAWDPLFLRIAQERHYKAWIFSANGCPPLLHVRRSDSLGTTSCSKFGLGEDILQSISNLHPIDIVVIARWSLYANGWYQDGTLREATHFLTTSATDAATVATSRAALESQLAPTADALTRVASGRVLFIKSLPILKAGIGVGLMRRPDSFEPTASENAEWERFSSTALATLVQKSGVHLFDPTSYLCSQKCSAFYKGVAMYRDDNHISAQGALLFQNVISESLE
jgi:peptidoglycan/LPS O-acetylase OafA/YrhL